MPYIDHPLPADFDIQPLAPPKRKPKFIPSGKPKGATALIGRDLKQQILMAAAAQGFDGAGQGQLQGFLQMCAARYPKAYLHVLAKLVPLQVQSEASASITSVHVHSIPSRTFLSSEDIARMSPRLEIEHEPQPVEETEAAPIEPEAPPHEQPSSEEARLKALEAELNSLSYEELKNRALQCGLDPNLLGSSSNTNGY
jgi:hypothetical protein